LVGSGAGAELGIGRVGDLTYFGRHCFLSFGGDSNSVRF
jgi:hypothetical protein